MVWFLSGTRKEGSPYGRDPQRSQTRQTPKPWGADLQSSRTAMWWSPWGAQIDQNGRVTMQKSLSSTKITCLETTATISSQRTKMATQLHLRHGHWCWSMSWQFASMPQSSCQMRTRRFVLHSRQRGGIQPQRSATSQHLLRSTASVQPKLHSQRWWDNHKVPQRAKARPSSRERQRALLVPHIHQQGNPYASGTTRRMNAADSRSASSDMFADCASLTSTQCLPAMRRSSKTLQRTPKVWVPDPEGCSKCSTSSLEGEGRIQWLLVLDNLQGSTMWL